MAVVGGNVDSGFNRDWVQIGTSHHHLGKSHLLECGGYPEWGSDKSIGTSGA